ncbi:hypothetical protein B0H19DRAFT_1063178 [Mycena capillaripes]|nr:hypothetical protein B0H19DRAFT_1063178 [Mycena capillaripes]
MPGGDLKYKANQGRTSRALAARMGGWVRMRGMSRNKCFWHYAPDHWLLWYRYEAIVRERTLDFALPDWATNGHLASRIALPCLRPEPVPNAESSPAPAPAPARARNGRARSQIARHPLTTQWPDLLAHGASRSPLPLQTTRCPYVPARGASTRPPAPPAASVDEQPPVRAPSPPPAEDSVGKDLDSPHKETPAAADEQPPAASDVDSPCKETPAAADEQPPAASVDEQPPAHAHSPPPAEDSVPKKLDSPRKEAPAPASSLAADGHHRALPPYTEDTVAKVFIGQLSMTINLTQSTKDTAMPPPRDEVPRATPPRAEDTVAKDATFSPPRQPKKIPPYLQAWYARRAAAGEEADRSARDNDRQGFLPGDTSAALHSLNSLMAPSSRELDLRSHLQLPAHSTLPLPQPLPPANPSVAPPPPPPAHAPAPTPPTPAPLAPASLAPTPPAPPAFVRAVPQALPRVNFSLMSALPPRRPAKASAKTRAMPEVETGGDAMDVIDNIGGAGDFHPAEDFDLDYDVGGAGGGEFNKFEDNDGKGYTEVSPTQSEDDSGSNESDDDDYAAKAAKAEAKLRDERETLYFKKGVRLQEEDDDDDERAFEAEAAAEEAARKKGKGKATASQKARKTTYAGPYKPGPVDKASHDVLFKLKEEYETQVEELAAKLNKPVNVLWKIVGSTQTHVRQASAWNIFTRWANSPNGGKGKDPELTVSERYTQLLESVGLDRKSSPSAAVMLEKVSWLAEWHKEFQAAVLAADDDSEHGSRRRAISSLAGELAKLNIQSERAHKDLDVHVLGWVVCTSGGSKSFGASPAYKLFKSRYQNDSKRTLLELQSKLHVLDMELAGATAASLLKSSHQVGVEWPSQTTYATGEKKRDAMRKFIKDRLVIDILNVQVEQGVLATEDAASAQVDMRWATWADYAYENRLHLENWDDAMAARDAWPKKGFALNKFTAEDVARIVPAMEARHGMPPVSKKSGATSDEEEDDDDDEEGSDAEDQEGVTTKSAKSKKVADAEDALRIVVWGEDDIELPLAECGRVPLVSTVSRVVLIRVQDSKKWSAAVEKQRAKKEKDAEKHKKKKRPRSSPSPRRSISRSRSASPPRLRPRRSTDSRPGGHRESGTFDRRDRNDYRDRGDRRGRQGRRSPAPDRERTSGAHDSDSRAPVAGTSKRRIEAPATSSTHHTDERAVKRQRITEKEDRPTKLSKSQRTHLTQFYREAQEEDAAAPHSHNPPLIKFRLRNGEDTSPRFHGILSAVVDGSHSQADRHTEYKDKNTGIWTPLAATYECRLTGKDLQIYEKWVERWSLE